MRTRRAGGRSLSLLCALTLLVASCSSLDDFETGGARNGGTADTPATESGDSNTSDGGSGDGNVPDDPSVTGEQAPDDPSIVDPGQINPDVPDDPSIAPPADADPNAAVDPDAEDAANALEAGGVDIPDVEVLRIQPRVIGTYPHATQAFTQGLEFDGNQLLESTGLYGESSRRRVNPGSGVVQITQPLAAEEFGQGLTVHNGNLIQLTWKEGVAIVADPATLDEVSRIPYDAEGWGICSLGDRIVTSDGTDQLQYRDPASLQLISTLAVTIDGEPLDRLNELECIDGLIWANVWLTADIVQIDPITGQVLTLIDASAIVPDGVGDEDVLNGIAFHRTARTMFVTGKRWNVMYELEYPFEDAPAS